MFVWPKHESMGPAEPVASIYAGAYDRSLVSEPATRLGLLLPALRAFLFRANGCCDAVAAAG